MIEIAGESQLGHRDEQQDAWCQFGDDGGGVNFVVVADGAGGMGQGREASQAVIASAEAFWQRQDPAALERASLGQALEAFAQDAHEGVRAETIDGRSTVVALLRVGDRVAWIHSGDSRLYFFRGGKLQRRTADHSLAHLLFERGKIAEEDLARHPDQNRLLQSLGGSYYDKPATDAAILRAGDVLVLCSDGFWTEVGAGEFIAGIGQSLLHQHVASLVRGAAEAHRASDNVTAVFCSCR